MTLAELLQSLSQGASNSVASNVSAPVDGIAWALRKAGVPVPSNPVGGSDWLAQKGLTREPKNRLGGLLGEFAGMAGPMVAAAKAPQIAGGLLQALDNAAIPQTLNRQAGVFIGPGAKTWNADAAAKAKALADAGTNARQVWVETGTWKGPDGIWRQEIPDNIAKMTPELRKMEPKQTINMGDALRHNALYNAYPELSRTGIQHRAFPVAGSDAYASYVKRLDEVVVNSSHPRYKKQSDIKSSVLHELQHAIQEREGFQLAGNLKDGMDKYRRLAGEAEARATQARIPLNAIERRAMFPEDSYDVPMNQLIVRR